MPYAIENRDGKVVVVNKQTGAVKGRHATKGKAIAQLDKLHMIERREGGVRAPHAHRRHTPRPGGGSDGKQNPFEAAARQPLDQADAPISEEGEPLDDGQDEEQAEDSGADDLAAAFAETKSRRKRRFGG